MATSFLQQQYAAQIAKGGRSSDRPTQATSIRAIIDPRFEALITHSSASPRVNQISPEVHNDRYSSSTNFNTPLDLKSEKVKIQQSHSAMSKGRLQGLLIGLVMGVIAVAIVLAVLLTRSSSSTSTSCNTLQWNPVGVTIIGNGSNGSSLNQLDTPWGVFVDGHDVVYIADTNNHRILNVPSVVTNGSSSGTVVAGVTGVPGNGTGFLNQPAAVSVDSQQNLYIADTYNYRVQLWLYGASSGSTVAGSSSGIPGSALDLLGSDYALYVDGASNVYVSDEYHGRIVKWPPAASTGILVAGANGSSGTGSNQLWRPYGITVDSNSGMLYIADHYANTVVAWQSGATNGKIVVGSNSTRGSLASLLNYPWGILRDTYGNLYVSDTGNHRIQMFCAVGSSFANGSTIAGIGFSQLSSIALSSPAGIAFDSEMNLYVADSGNHRIQKFSRIF